MLSPADAVWVCSAPANLPPPPHTPSSGTSSSSSRHCCMALAPHSGWVSAQAFWGAWRVMGSASVSSPSHCIPAADAKFCFSHSPLVSAVDGEMPGLSCPGQSGRDLLLGSVSVSQPEPRAVAGSGAWLVQKEREDQHSHAHGTAELGAAVLPEGRQHGWPRAASVIPAQCRLGTHLASWS